jgi:MYXO-CTERM domain-containing protein
MAHADALRLGYDDTAADPAEDFDDACLGDAVADDCDTRAALMEGELVMLLSRLEADSAPETEALFREALELDSPVVQALATRYFARADRQPDDFLSKLKTFLFGPDAPLGVSAAEALDASADADDALLADLYREQRSVADYGVGPVSEAADEDLVLSCTNDARLELMASFGTDEQFAPAQRLLMYDRFVTDLLNPSLDYPVTSFVTDASLEEVAEFFRERFGEPYGPVAEIEARIERLTIELAPLQAAAASGDPAAMKAWAEAVQVLTAAHEELTAGAYYQLSSIHAQNDLVWIDGDTPELAEQLPRAVTAGEDVLLGKTVIRYINAPREASANPGEEPNGSGGESGAPPGNGSAGEGLGGDGEPGASPAPSDDGCGCSIPGAPRRSVEVTGFALLALLLRRARRRAP